MSLARVATACNTRTVRAGRPYILAIACDAVRLAPRTSGDIPGEARGSKPAARGRWWDAYAHAHARGCAVAACARRSVVRLCEPPVESSRVPVASPMIMIALSIVKSFGLFFSLTAPAGVPPLSLTADTGTGCVVCPFAQLRSFTLFILLIFVGCRSLCTYAV